MVGYASFLYKAASLSSRHPNMIPKSSHTNSTMGQPVIDLFPPFFIQPPVNNQVLTVQLDRFSNPRPHLQGKSPT